MYPTFEKIREMAAGDYKRIPICKELYADSYTPVEMMRILQKASHHCYLLESASQSEAWGRYSFLGYDPSMESPVQTESCGFEKPVRRKLLVEAAMLQKAVQKAVQKRFDRLPIQAMLSVKSSVSTKVRLWTICPHLPAVW